VAVGVTGRGAAEEYNQRRKPWVLGWDTTSPGRTKEKARRKLRRADTGSHPHSFALRKIPPHTVPFRESKTTKSGFCCSILPIHT